MGRILLGAVAIFVAIFIVLAIVHVIFSYFIFLALIALLGFGLFRMGRWSGRRGGRRY